MPWNFSKETAWACRSYRCPWEQCQSPSCPLQPQNSFSLLRACSSTCRQQRQEQSHFCTGSSSLLGLIWRRLRRVCPAAEQCSRQTESVALVLIAAVPFAGLSLTQASKINGSARNCNENVWANWSQWRQMSPYTFWVQTGGTAVHTRSKMWLLGVKNRGLGWK